MYCKLVFATLAVLVGNDFVTAQQIPSTTTAAELWNPWTWFWPYAIATAEAYRDYYQKAQKATNELYQQIEKTNAFPWMTGNWGLSQVKPGGVTGQNNTGIGGGQTNQDGGKNNQGNVNTPADKNTQNQPTNGSQVQGDVSGNSTKSE